MHVQQAGATGTGVREGVDGAGRRGDVGAGAAAQDLVADLEPWLALEHVERIDVELVDVRPRPFEAGLELELDERELLATDLDRQGARLPGVSLALAGA